MALITTAQAADYLGVTPRTIRSMIKTRMIPAVRIVSEYRIDQEDLDQFIRENKTPSLSRS